MVNKCKCGGRLRRVDLRMEWSEELKRVQVIDTNRELATWKCTKCGVFRTQRKRQAKEA